ncbi:hypothetical protein, partial [Saccharophagus degradans]|uniref:hypothetical protein n=1 Tax=Saccharophagus degradans TaxID=86304 RepID=UPI0026E2E1AE
VKWRSHPKTERSKHCPFNNIVRTPAYATKQTLPAQATLTVFLQAAHGPFSFTSMAPQCPTLYIVMRP